MRCKFRKTVEESENFTAGHKFRSIFLVPIFVNDSFSVTIYDHPLGFSHIKTNSAISTFVNSADEIACVL